MTTLSTKIKQLDGLVDTPLVADRENDFIQDVVKETKNGLVTSVLTEKQIEFIDSIYDQHFAST